MRKYEKPFVRVYYSVHHEYMLYRMAGRKYVLPFSQTLSDTLRVSLRGRYNDPLCTIPRDCVTFEGAGLRSCLIHYFAVVGARILGDSAVVGAHNLCLDPRSSLSWRSKYLTLADTSRSPNLSVNGCTHGYRPVNGCMSILNAIFLESDSVVEGDAESNPSHRRSTCPLS
jgi:hypothetical protein